jgi:hypothetical protein
MTARTRVWAGLVVAVLPIAAACNELTEVVLVIESDLMPFTEVNAFDATIAPGPVAPVPVNGLFVSGVTSFPLSIGFVSHGETKSFSLVARLLVGTPGAPQRLVVSRTVSDVRFVEGEVRMFVLTMPRACACQGTACPLPGDPACDKLTNPTLEPFDPARAPRSTMFSSPSLSF